MDEFRLDGLDNVASANWTMRSAPLNTTEAAIEARLDGRVV